MVSAALDISDRHRQFAELVSQGVPAGRAYEKAGFKARGASADTEASKTLRNPKVAKRLQSLRQEAAARATITRDDAIVMLAAILRAKPSEASLDNPLCELRMNRGIPYAVFPDKARCLERLAKMLAWDDFQSVREPMKIHVVIGGDSPE
jgi:hypothetical protein